MNFDALLFNQTGFILFVLDSNGRFLSVNPAAERLFHASQRDLAGLPFQTVLDEYSFAKADQMIALTLENGAVKDWELNHIQPDTEPVLVEYTTCVLRDKNSQIVGIGAVGSNLNLELDLTVQLAATNQELEGALLQLEKTHAELKSTQAQLLQSEKMRALGQMVAGVAHEINNPLGFARNNFIFLSEKLPALQALFTRYASLKKNATSGDLRAIEQAEQRAGIDYLWDDFNDAVQEGLEGINRIREIVLSLLNFSRLDEAEVKEADLNEGLRSTIRLLQASCKDRIQIEESYGAIPKTFCHPGELNQVFLNLLTNSVQAIEGPGQIQVATNNSDGRIRIQISDSGKGMDPQTLSKLGEPFFTTKPVGAGVGLGLAVSFGIIQRHKGTIHFESRPGSGTVVVIDLPIVS
jgi:two-component system NtrC family sensor kinase